MNANLYCTCGCTCGLVKGSAGPLSRVLNKRIVCMCKDCQAYAHYLGRTDLMLDDQGGTEIIAIHPARIRFTEGADQLACVRLSDDGLRRWFAKCCKTPIANTHHGNRLPFAGVHRSALLLNQGESLGEVYGRINGSDAHGVLRATLSAVRFMLYGFAKGLNSPWPFPEVSPVVGTDAEYFALLDKVEAASLARAFRR